MIPYSWVTFCQANPPFGRWDQAYIGRLLGGLEWCVPNVWYQEIPWNPDSTEGQIMVVPAGHYAEHGPGCLESAVQRLRAALERRDWVVVILTSDESSSFPISRFDDLTHVTWWVMLPAPTRIYPPGTVFIGEGSPMPGRDIAMLSDNDLSTDQWVKDTDVFFAGQINHKRREELDRVMRGWDGEGFNVEYHPTAGFTQGMPQVSYYKALARSRVVPCPSGVVSHSSFRFYETLEAQGIPIADALSPISSAVGYWDRVHPNMPVPTIRDWQNLPTLSAAFASDERFPYYAARISSWWQCEKRNYAYRLAFDCNADISLQPAITVLVPTSPSPLHPDPSMTIDTILSVRERLPEAEIVILADGVRTEQQDRGPAYYEYLRRLFAWTNTQQNIVPLMFDEHMHQAAMTQHAIRSGHVMTDFVMFVEHDAPLTGDIPFDDIIQTMLDDRLNVMRFHHETHVLDEHAHIYLEREPVNTSGVPYVRTMQWSQRPHIATTEFYEAMLDRYFATDARTMIEDVMHAITEAAWIHFGEDGWKKWRLALYAPSGPSGYLRSLHSDGRKDDPKYPMTFSYPGETPLGAPHPGTR